MSDSLDPRSVEESLKNLLKAKGTTQELLAMTRAYGSALGQSYGTIAKTNEAIRDQEKLAEKIKRNSLETTLSEEKRLALSKLASNIEESAYDIAQKQAKVRADIVLKQTMLNTGLVDEYAEQAKNYALALSMGELTDDEYAKKIATLKLEQHQNQILDEQLEIIEEIAKLELEAREEVEKYTKGWEKTKALLTSIATNPELNKTIFKGLLIKKSAEAFKELKESVTEFRKEGESVTQAFHSLGQTLSVNSLILGQDTKGALTGLQTQMGDLHAITDDTVDQTAGMAQAFGLTGDEAGGLVGSLAQMPGLTQKSATNMGLMTGRLAVSAGVKPGVVLKDMAKNTENIAKFSAKGGESFMRAAVGAAKMGIEVNKIATAAEGLLDFENSINKQMEASVLLGKTINFDKAAELALNGDLAGATQEMLKQLGSEAEFNKMNLLQKKALAAAMGMSVEDLGKLVKNQNKFTEAQREALQQGKSIDEVLAMGAGTASKFGKMFNKENLLLFFTAMNSFGGLKGVFGAMSSGFKAVREAGGGIIKGVVGGVKNMFKGDEGDKVSNVTNKMGKGGMGGFKKSMQDLAAGLKAMGNLKVTGGIANLLFFGVAAAIAAIPSAIFLPVIGVFGVMAGKGLKGLASGLKAFANGEVMLGVAILDALVLGVGAGIWMFGLGIKAAGQGIGSLADALLKMPFKELYGLGPALFAIAGGLNAMAVGGILAMPTIGALTKLGTIAPNISGLGGKQEKGSREESELKKLTGEIEKLVKSIQKPVPIVINLDGKKIGDGTYNASIKTSSGGKVG